MSPSLPGSHSPAILHAFVLLLFKGRNSVLTLMKSLGLFNSFSITPERSKWGEEKTHQLSQPFLFSVNFLNHDENRPDVSNILHVEMMVFQVRASPVLMRM